MVARLGVHVIETTKGSVLPLSAISRPPPGLGESTPHIITSKQEVIDHTEPSRPAPSSSLMNQAARNITEVMVMDETGVDPQPIGCEIAGKFNELSS